MKNKILILTVFLMRVCLFAQETITIDAGTDNGNFGNYTGFIHGQSRIELNSEGLDMLKKLKPKYWRNANWNRTQFLADSLNINTTLVISDFYAELKGGYANAKPWLNWAEYENIVDTLLDLYTSAGIAPNFWDVWNEPNDVNYWSGTRNQLIECIIRTTQIVKAVNPAIKLVGPSTNYYDPAFMEFLLDTLATRSITLDAVSWHEFGLPDSLDNHIVDFRKRKTSNAQWGDPEIHINEYSPAATQQIPAYRLGWLYHLEKNNVDWANTACWDNFDGKTHWSGCNYGLNGLLWYDEKSPLPVYWLQKAYANMSSAKKLFCTHSDVKTLALSGKFDNSKEMHILAGRYYSVADGTFLPSDQGKESSNVKITINNYPYKTEGEVAVLIQRIQKGDVAYQNSPLLSPTTIFEGTVSVVGGNINFNVTDFKDGDVYCTYIKTDTANAWIGSILGISETKAEENFTIYPNPAGSQFFLSVSNATEGMYELVIYDMVGKQAQNQSFELRGKNSFNEAIDVSQLANGIYIVKVSVNKETRVMKLTISK